MVKETTQAKQKLMARVKLPPLSLSSTLFWAGTRSISVGFVRPVRPRLVLVRWFPKDVDLFSRKQRTSPGWWVPPGAGGPCLGLVRFVVLRLFADAGCWLLACLLWLLAFYGVGKVTFCAGGRGGRRGKTHDGDGGACFFRPSMPCMARHSGGAFAGLAGLRALEPLEPLLPPLPCYPTVTGPWLLTAGNCQGSSSGIFYKVSR